MKSTCSGVFVSLVYYGVTEILLHRSPAKYLTRTTVVMKNGLKPPIVDILARTILRIIPFEPLSFLRGRELGMHDKNSNTFVVVKSKLEERKKEYLELKSLEKT